MVGEVEAAIYVYVFNIESSTLSQMQVGRDLAFSLIFRFVTLLLISSSFLISMIRYFCIFVEILLIILPF